MKKKWFKRISGFDVVNGVLLLLTAAIMLYPLLNVVAVAFSSYEGYIKNPMMILPHDFTLESFVRVFQDKKILSGYRNTLFITIIGTVFGVLVTTLTAYPLSKKDLYGKPVIMGYIVTTMMFSGGIVPAYFLIRNLRLLDSLWSLILPTAVTAYNIILMKNSFEQLPHSLVEAARIDGAGEFYILFKIVLPISKAIIATIALFTAVGYWNSYFNAVLYISDPDKQPLQMVLNEIIKNAESAAAEFGGNLAESSMEIIPTQGLKYSTLIVVIVPVLCIYPFLQKYFAAGVTVGSVKG